MNAAAEIRFLRSIQRLLDEGDFVATYKLALLQALTDLSVEISGDDSKGLKIPLIRIAEKFAEYYWGHIVPFRPTQNQTGVLLQNTGKQASILTALGVLREHHSSITAARRSPRWKSTVRSIASTVRNMPLWKLQTVAGSSEEFLYRKQDSTSDSILLLPGVASNFRSFHGIVLRLVRGKWVERIKAIQANASIIGPTSDLETFLFGSERKSLDSFRTILHEIDGNRCFYCERPIQRECNVDHFIPWSRYPVDLGHNFVLAHSTCNLSKRDFLADVRHLKRWTERNTALGSNLSQAFTGLGLPHDLSRTIAVAQWAYSQGESSGGHAWIEKASFTNLGGEWRDYLFS